MIDVNLWGVVHGTRAFLPLLRERGEGHIVNIASINAMVPFAKNGPYDMSKYAVYGLNETLMQELHGDTIRVTSVHPGGIQTNIARNGKHISQAEAAYFDKTARTSASSGRSHLARRRAQPGALLHRRRRAHDGAGKASTASSHSTLGRRIF